MAARIDDYFSTDAFPTDTKPEAAFLSNAMREFEEVIDFSRLLGYITVGIILQHDLHVHAGPHQGNSSAAHAGIHACPRDFAYRV